MCGCKRHYLKSALCTCTCESHKDVRKVDPGPAPFGWVDPENTTLRLNADNEMRVQVSAPIPGEVPVWLTEDDGLANWERALLAEVDAEDTDDVEPEPLKAGDWVWVAGQITETHHHPEDVTVEMFSHNEQYEADVRRDRVERMAGVPPWVKPARKVTTHEDVLRAITAFSEALRPLAKQMEDAARELGRSIRHGVSDGAS